MTKKILLFLIVISASYVVMALTTQKGQIHSKPMLVADNSSDNSNNDTDDSDFC